jgi:cephalosporin-C deacetylase
MYAAWNLIEAEKEIHVFQETQHWTFPEQQLMKNDWLVEKLLK